MSLTRSATIALALLASWAPAAAQDIDLRSVFEAPVTIERHAALVSVPIEIRAGKLFVGAAVNGQPGQFIFDTGSPTILAREFAQSLDLEIVGQNTGVDANGSPVTMDVAIVDSIAIGDVSFRHVPVLVFDFSNLTAGSCFFGSGVLGSEIFPHSAWRIDLQSNRLSIAESAAALAVSDEAVRARLYDFGYPHAPIIDYVIGDVADKALFDTGSAEQLALFRPVLENPTVQETVIPASMRSGRGYEGESAGGLGQLVDLARFEVSGLRVGEHPMGNVSAATRAMPPTLLGAGMLRSHVVTLDYPGRQMLLEPRATPAPARLRPGYGLAFDGEHAVVAQLFENSAAARAGLRLGDRVTAAQGRSLVVTPDNPRCDSARWLAESFDGSTALELQVLRGDQVRTIRVPANE